MNAHPTSDELLLFLRGGLRADRVPAVTRHLRDCPRCRAAAMPENRLTHAAERLRRAIDPAVNEHPPLDSVLALYAEGKLGGASKGEVETHLESCPVCREDVVDIRATAAAIAPRRSRWWPIAVAAAAAVVVITTTLIVRREAEEPIPVGPPRATTQPPIVENRPPTGYGRAEWDELVSHARQGRLLPIPHALAALRPPPAVLRGSPSANARLMPAGIVMKTSRPEFRWPAPAGARSTVVVFRGDDEVLRSGTLTTTRWTPPRDLARGVTYSWEVNLDHENQKQILPSPPAPPARFHVVDSIALAEIEAAERQYPKDDLLLGLLYTRAGLEAEAREHLRRVTDARDAATAQRILRNLDSWSGI